MSESPHPAAQFAEPLKDLAEGRVEPDAWLAWWSAHAGEIERLCPRGWFLKLKPMHVDDSGVNRAAAISQDGACYVLAALRVPFVRSDRYQRAWEEDSRRFREQEEARQRLTSEQFTPRVAALDAVFPKLGRFLKKHMDKIDRMDEPAEEAEIATAEQTLGVSLPGSYRQFLKCTRQLSLEGFSLGLDTTFAHPAPIMGKADAAAICIAEYWLEADGDQVLLQRCASPDADPPVFYYAHEGGAHAARELAAHFSAWLESLPRSPVFQH